MCFSLQPLCVCYIVFPSSINGVSKEHILPNRSNRVNMCSICPIFQPFQHCFCAISGIFIVHCSCLPICDTLGAFRHEKNYQLVIYCHVVSTFLCNMSIIAAIFCNISCLFCLMLHLVFFFVVDYYILFHCCRLPGCDALGAFRQEENTILFKTQHTLCR